MGYLKSKKAASVISVGPSNSIAGPRCMLDLPPPTAARGPRANFTKTAFSNTSASWRSTAGAPAVPARGSGDPAQLTSDFTLMDVNGPVQLNIRTYDPSNGPSPSNMTVASRPFSVVAPSFKSSRSNTSPIKTALCTLNNRTRLSFNRGNIVSVPVHKTNRDARADLSDKHLTKTACGGVYSKRRMIVVLWITYENMFCLPLHTFSHTGLRKKPNGMHSEFVCIKNETDEAFSNHGMYPPIEANCRTDLVPNSVLALGDHVEVGCRDDIAPVGKMTKNGFTHLLALWENVVAQAKNEPRKPRTRGFGNRNAISGLPAIREGT